MPIKFLTAQGSGSLADAVESIKYATKMRVHVMSNSWGGGGFSKAMEDAIKEARDAGILFVAAAGNESNNNDARPTYPAGYQVENVLSVAAIDNRDALASFSNYGARLVHIGAPGVRIWSSVPGNRYESLSGTSMACPHVAGAAALLWSLNRGMTYADIKTRLISTAEPTRALQRKTVAGGRLNIANAISGHTPSRPGPSDSEWIAMGTEVRSEHPYADNAAQSFEVSVPGARYIRVHFSRLQVEEGYDFVKLVDSTGAEVETLTGDMEDYTSVYGDGEKLYIQLESDGSINAWGFYIDRIEYVM
jgi:subtilisin family serine protease